MLQDSVETISSKLASLSAVIDSIEREMEIQDMEFLQVTPLLPHMHKNVWFLRALRLKASVIIGED